LGAGVTPASLKEFVCEETFMSHKNTSVFGLYPNETELGECLEELKRSGFRATDFSILLPENLGSKDIGHEKHTKAPEGAIAGGMVGAILGGAIAWAMSSNLIHITFPGSESLVASGAVISILAGVGALGLLGALLGAFFGGFSPEYEAKRYNGRIRAGSVLLSVHCDNADWRKRAKETMLRTGARGIGSAVESEADFGASVKPKSRLPITGYPNRHRSFLKPENNEPLIEPQQPEPHPVGASWPERDPLE
jgi:hypothetical protein